MKVYEFFRRLSLFSVLMALGTLVLLGGLAFSLYCLERSEGVDLPEAGEKQLSHARPFPAHLSPLYQVRLHNRLIRRRQAYRAVAYGGSLQCEHTQYDIFLAPYYEPPMPTSFTITIEIPREKWDAMMVQLEQEAEERKLRNRMKRWVQNWWSS